MTVNFESDVHFNEVANCYEQLRENVYLIDIIDIMKKYITKNDILMDIACGTGRISTNVCRSLDLRLILVDKNIRMLNVAMKKINMQYKKNKLINMDIYDFLENNGKKDNVKINDINIFTCFNAIHWIGLGLFKKLEEKMSPGSLFVILTRTKQQNKESFFGLNFPKFADKETRLFSLNQLLDEFKKCNLSVVDTKFLKYQISQKKSKLLEQATKKSYSTFQLYSNEEYEKAMRIFKDNLSSKPEILKVNYNNLLILGRK